jgi:exodeoxyribonuclease VII large subunit
VDSQILSVKEFLGVLNDTLVFAFPVVVIEGEVSGYKVSQGKWVFFDLKDDSATLGCFMPLYSLKTPLEDGMRVRVTGSPKLTNWGKFSFTVRGLELTGEGQLRRAYELLKARLEQAGLFAPERKRAIPEFPATIGLVTSGTSAAYADFVKILSERWGGVRILLADVAVQGASAPDQLVSALRYFDELPVPPDVLVMVRGGGSLEDLQAFNTEQVTRAVAASRVPTVVGIGHEVDTSLAELAADVRAATPTDAARRVVPDRVEMLARVGYAWDRLDGAWNRLVVSMAKQLDDYLYGLGRFLSVPQARVAAMELGLMNGMSGLYADGKTRLIQLERLLQGYNPKAVLARGYAIVRQNGQVVQDAASVQTGSRLMIELYKSTMEVEKRP